MSQPRRSARIAAKNVAKASSIPSPCNSVAFTNFTGPGQGGKSPLYQEMKKYHPLPKSGWHLDYPVLRDDIDIKNPKVLQGLIEDHERLHQWDGDLADEICNSQWEKELMVAARWLCVDNRLLKASPKMLAKGNKYAWTANDSFPALYAQIECLEMQLPTLKGVAVDKVHRQLLESNLLLQLTYYVHDKWNLFMNEMEEEEQCKPLDSDDEDY